MDQSARLLRDLWEIDRRAAVWGAARCVRAVLGLIDEREPSRSAELAVVAAEAWVRGEAGEADCRRASDEARRLGRAITGAGRRGADAAYAAGYAARAVYDTSGFSEAIFHAAAAYATASVERARAAGEAAIEAADRGALEVGGYDKIGTFSHLMPDESTVYRDAYRERLDQLCGLVAAERWPLTLLRTEQILGASNAVQVAWDAVAASAPEPTIGALLEAHARARRSGLRWEDPVERAVAERSRDGALAALEVFLRNS